MALISRGRQLGQISRGAARLRTIVGVFASHGFQNLAERARLGQFILRRMFPNVDEEKYTAPERMRMAFEQLGPTFIKFGQLLATRPDLVPEEFVEEFKHLQDNVKSLPFVEIQDLLVRHFGDVHRIFRQIDSEPLGSASIAQVHRATLMDGTHVVIKVRKPGIVELINEDLNVLYTLASLLNRYVPEVRVFNPVGIVDEFFKTLELETNFVVEANNIRRFHNNFYGEPRIKIPRVFNELSSENILVMEMIEGIRLSQLHQHPEHVLNRDELIRLGLKTYFKMVFKDRFFHGDLHAGNLILMPNQQLGLIDFGVVGRLSDTVRSGIADMLVFLSQEDYENFAATYVELTSDEDAVDVQRFARELRELIAPHFGLSFRQVNLGKLLMKSTRVAAKNGLTVPSELMLFFKSIVTVEGMGRLVVQDFDILSYALEFAQDIVKVKYDPEKVTKDLAIVARDASSLLLTLPRQLKQLLRKMNNPRTAWKISVSELEDLRHSIESSSNLIFLGFVFSSLVLAAAMTLDKVEMNVFAGLPIPTVVFGGFAFVTGIVAFFNYIKK